ncbi:hypothetical protein [Breoghania sp.]|uniref:hypothetical protein n=1 Tax=Breoghania sp. TaxID=2065378 RepID=UPI0026037309|nr:hypothetical protein [Breoghania sp.]
MRIGRRSVHCLFHTASFGKPDWLKRYCQFLEFIPKARGQFVGCEEAVALATQVEKSEKKEAVA